MAEIYKSMHASARLIDRYTGVSTTCAFPKAFTKCQQIENPPALSPNIVTLVVAHHISVNRREHGDSRDCPCHCMRNETNIPGPRYNALVRVASKAPNVVLRPLQTSSALRAREPSEYTVRGKAAATLRSELCATHAHISYALRRVTLRVPHL